MSQVVVLVGRGVEVATALVCYVRINPGLFVSAELPDALFATLSQEPR